MERFLDFIKPQNSSVSPSRPFHRPKWQISLAFYILQIPLSGGASPYRPSWEVPSGAPRAQGLPNKGPNSGIFFDSYAITDDARSS